MLMTRRGSNPPEAARSYGFRSAPGFERRALLLLRVARLAVVLPMRQAGRSKYVVTGRILLRFCDCASRSRWPQSAVPAGRNDLGGAVARSSAERGRPPAWIVSAAWPPFAPLTVGYLIRPPCRLLC
jgi:hypothetical protein